ncbi:hypothetical protein HT031_003089 [Scenedesmus sp. PABB004]|nr:hypothetical protein HT031_003089 [Scenedesmus sp. PABB004]
MLTAPSPARAVAAAARRPAPPTARRAPAGRRLAPPLRASPDFNAPCVRRRAAAPRAPPLPQPPTDRARARPRAPPVRGTDDSEMMGRDASERPEAGEEVTFSAAELRADDAGAGGDAAEAQAAGGGGRFGEEATEPRRPYSPSPKERGHGVPPHKDASNTHAPDERGGPTGAGGGASGGAQLGGVSIGPGEAAGGACAPGGGAFSEGGRANPEGDEQIPGAAI